MPASAVKYATGETLVERIAAARQKLVDAGLRAEDATIDADVLARHVLGWDVARLLARKREPPPPGFAEPFEAAIARRSQREPVAFITGRREFWGLDFAVNPATLVPRPESERIVEEALRFLPPGQSAAVIDVGTGSGCLAISIAHERPDVRVVATDLSHAALLVARTNAAAHKVGDRVAFVQTDLTSGLLARADVIVANPPYVPDQPPQALPSDVVRYEPAMALFGGTDGLTILRRLLSEAPAQLAPGGTLIVEFGYGQEDEVRQAAADAGWTVMDMLYDLQRIARTIVLRR
jgi:release factor glutamine methyltransferase